MPRMGLLDGKTAFITGGSRGIGRALCDVLAREGADIAFNYHSNDAAAEETKALVTGHGRQIRAYKIPVTDGEGMQKICRELVEAWGKVDILVNNAAINQAASFRTTTEAAWREVMEVNVNGLYYVTKPFFKQMLKQRTGQILNITSIAAIRALPTSVHYATAKASVIGFTKCLSREAAPFNVNVNAIAAGIFDTDLGHSLPSHLHATHASWNPKGRLGDPKELAEYAAFMVSDRNTYMTGEIVTIDGGTVA